MRDKIIDLKIDAATAVNNANLALGRLSICLENVKAFLEGGEIKHDC